MVANFSKISGKRILITGGCGFIGSFLTEQWLENNKITIFDNGRRNAFQFLSEEIKKKVLLIKGDIRDVKKVDKASNNQDIVIHLAAIAGASFYEKDPLLTLDVNLFGTANLLKVLSKKKIDRVITFSTSEVYGTKAANVSEDEPTPIGPVSEGRWSYAVSKVASDHLARAYFKKCNLPINIVRPFNIYGPRQVGEGAISNMLTSGIKDKKIYVSGDGSQKRAWCFITDIVKAVEQICESKISGECFNIGNPSAYLTTLELSQKILALCKGSKIIFTAGRVTEVLDRKPNIEKAKKILGFSPDIGLDEGLKITFQWWLENIARF